jgi:hypothetical protein
MPAREAPLRDLLERGPHSSDEKSSKLVVVKRLSPFNGFYEKPHEFRGFRLHPDAFAPPLPQPNASPTIYELGNQVLYETRIIFPLRSGFPSPAPVWIGERSEAQNERKATDCSVKTTTSSCF